MQVYKVDPLSDPRWDAFLGEQPDSSAFHRSQWLQALHHTYAYKPVVYTTTEPGLPLHDGLSFCRISSPLTGRRLVSTPFSDHCDVLIADECRLRFILNALKTEAADRQLKYVELRPLDAACAETLRAEGFGESERFVVHRLDISGDPETILENTHKTGVRQMIRRAERENLQVDIGNSPELLTKFCRLQTLTRRRHGIPPQPVEWFRNLMECKSIDPTIFVASKDGKPIAAVLTLCWGRLGHYKYSCSDSNYSNTGGTQLLIWRAILRLKDQGCESFCMGRSEPGNRGLVEFKSRWGAQRTMSSYYRYPAPASVSESTEESRLVSRVVSVMPEWALSAAGKFLYRHFG